MYDISMRKIAFITFVNIINCMMRNNKNSLMMCQTLVNQQNVCNPRNLCNSCMPQTSKLSEIKNKRRPNPTNNVETYIKTNTLTPFILFTIINECCKCIMMYHNLQNSYHGNTTLANFYMYDNYRCVLQSDDISHPLTISRKHDDYDIFFKSCNETIMDKNKHFTKFLRLYMSSISKHV